MRLAYRMPRHGDRRLVLSLWITGQASGEICIIFGPLGRGENIRAVGGENVRAVGGQEDSSSSQGHEGVIV